MAIKKLKVLLSAYACEPGKGSEPAVGWNIVREMAKLHEVWVITRANNRKAIESLGGNEFKKNLHFIYYDLPQWTRWWKRGGRGIQLYYYLWQIGIFSIAKNLHQKINFDLIHHTTFVKYWAPSFLAFLPVPFIWGPVGGGESTPKALWSGLSLRGKVYESVREFARWIGEHDPFVKQTAKRSAIALATTKETGERLRILGAGNVRFFSQIGLSNEEIADLPHCQFENKSPIKFISIGNLLHWKGFHLGLRAFAKAGLMNAEYYLVGDGPERKRLEKLVSKLKISDQVKFTGKISRHAVMKHLGDSQVLVHPSMHDSGGMVCVEAMAAERPVICLDCGGPALQISRDTGFAAPVFSSKQVIQDVATAMSKLVRNSSLRQSMGKNARQRVEDKFCWEKKANFISELYCEALASR